MLDFSKLSDTTVVIYYNVYLIIKKSYTFAHFYVRAALCVRHCNWFYYHLV